MPPTPPPAPISAARFVLSIAGGAQETFSELVGISSAIDTTPDTPAGTGKPPFGVTVPPKVVLKRGLDGDGALWAWHQLALQGDPAARKDCQLPLQDPGGQTLLTYDLVGAWPSSLDIAGPPAGAPPVVTETVELTCDTITISQGWPGPKHDHDPFSGRDPRKNGLVSRN